jgi:hypothetical protein
VGEEPGCEWARVGHTGEKKVGQGGGWTGLGERKEKEVGWAARED